MSDRTVGLVAQIVLSIVFTVGYFGVVYLFITGKAAVSDNLKDVFVTIIGVLTAGELGILNFWFSTSRSSSEKTALLAARAA
ncbi:MAG: hypothetical protein Q8N51_00955 [Gammaproteobacteria bacterium]|nr:hypothetical protein [Gammaproteobacteria bacterium]